MTMKCYDETDARCNIKVNRGESGRRGVLAPRGVRAPELGDLCHTRICAPDAELIFSPPGPRVTSRSEKPLITVSGFVTTVADITSRAV